MRGRVELGRAVGGITIGRGVSVGDDGGGVRERTKSEGHSIPLIKTR